MMNNWYKLLYWLRHNCPYHNKISVRCKSKLNGQNKNDAGVCIQFDDGSIVIEINKNQSFDSKIDTLLHEWAHALSFDSKDVNEHGSEWGKQYARIYRKYLKWDWGR